MNELNKPGVGFWAAIALAAALVYPLSFGPACWLASHHWIPLRLQPPVYWTYRPLTLFAFHERCSVARGFNWWADVGIDEEPGDGVFSLWCLEHEEEGDGDRLDPTRGLSVK